jgi:hypothetical protein
MNPRTRFTLPPELAATEPPEQRGLARHRRVVFQRRDQRGRELASLFAQRRDNLHGALSHDRDRIFEGRFEAFSQSVRIGADGGRRAECRRPDERVAVAAQLY